MVQNSGSLPYSGVKIIFHKKTPETSKIAITKEKVPVYL